ncbi:5-(carboxyamino)imidazole ribonucleotide mutase [archaeon]|nr:5-(carboxyamino)imidazole ribonucleotide mutase [archaeon]
MITIISGSESDKDLVEKIEAVLKEFEVEFDSHVASAHRTPKRVEEIVKNSKSDVFIGVAGLSAALPGAIASHTVKPVIGLPKNVKLSGLDSFLSIAQMPPGVPVATVGVDNAKNAAFLALEILAIKDAGLKEKLKEYRNL